MRSPYWRGTCDLITIEKNSPISIVRQNAVTWLIFKLKQARTARDPSFHTHQRLIWKGAAEAQ
jgi:hypothetical protein